MDKEKEIKRIKNLDIKALILVDFEKEWINKNSDYFIGDISQVIEKVNNLIDFCRKNKYKVIFIRHIEKNSKKTFIENSENVEIIDKIHKKNSDTIITKYKIDSFLKTNLEKELQKTKQIIVCGILTNLCVRSLIEGAYDRNFDIIVIKDCCVSFDKETQKFTFKDLKNNREEIKFLNLKIFLSNTKE